MTSRARTAAAGAPAVRSALIRCEACGEETEHTILRLEGADGSGVGRALRGIARCRVCRLTQPFEVVAPRSTRVRVIISEGPTSRTELVELPPGDRISLETDLPREGGSPWRVRRIERPDGRGVSSALPSEIGALWVTPYQGETVPVSIIEGRRTHALSWTLAPDVRLEVGQEIEIDHEPIRIVALRARGHTWKVPGDGFGAGEIQRVYARRIVSPPVGRSAWSRDRPMSRARASSTSRSARSRSSPGPR